MRFDTGFNRMNVICFSQGTIHSTDEVNTFLYSSDMTFLRETGCCVPKNSKIG